jgi:hypothetical protein
MTHAPAKTKFRARAAVAELGNDSFEVELRCACAVVLPVTLTLKWMDRRVVKAWQVYEIWEKLGDKIVAAFEKDECSSLSLATKMRLVGIYEDEWNSSYTRAIGAAFALNPKNRAALAKLADGTEDERDEYNVLVQDTKEVLEHVILRWKREFSEDKKLAEVKQVWEELDSYLLAMSPFDKALVQDPTKWWAGVSTNNLLWRHALRVLGVLVTISNVEVSVYAIMPNARETNSEKTAHAQGQLSLPHQASQPACRTAR